MLQMITLNNQFIAAEIANPDSAIQKPVGLLS